ncbi:protein BEAN1 [Dipodomys spectabilis]|uniref:protein BEAN1 n=1 Tax=Dipodomys spectabilis TaxID=105255 RepID=UPI001C547DC1|nr:protein BEAN1 [Dipodomys spectabilis]
MAQPHRATLSPCARIAGDRSAGLRRAPPRRPAPPRLLRPPRRRRERSPSAVASERDPEREREPEPEREPELEPKLEPALQRTGRSAAAKPIRAVPVGRLAPLFCSKDYMSFKRSCPLARYNHTSYFYPTFSDSSEHSHLLVSPVLVASAVIGVVITLSCITIIVGSIRRDRQARLQHHHHHHHRRRHHHHRHRRRRHQEYEPGYVSDGHTGHTHSRSSRRMHYTCSPAEDWPPPLDISSDGDVDATVLRELYPDSPPGYEECVGPGATQLYVPTDAPPPYSLTDSCPTLNGAPDSGSGHSHSQHQQEQRTRGQAGLYAVSMDTLPPYEVVCGTRSPSDLLPLPGSEPGPRNSPGWPTPRWTPASSPERAV